MLRKDDSVFSFFSLPFNKITLFRAASCSGGSASTVVGAGSAAVVCCSAGSSPDLPLPSSFSTFILSNITCKHGSQQRQTRVIPRLHMQIRCLIMFTMITLTFFLLFFIFNFSRHTYVTSNNQLFH